MLTAIDHGALCLQLDEERVHHDAPVVDNAGNHGQPSGVLPMVSQTASEIQCIYPDLYTVNSIMSVIQY